MTSQERATLRKYANGMDAIYQIGKEEINANLMRGVGEALAKRELIKLQVQGNSMYTAKEAAQELAAALKAEVVQVIGNRFVLYRFNKEINNYGIKQ